MNTNNQHIRAQGVSIYALLLPLTLSGISLQYGCGDEEISPALLPVDQGALSRDQMLYIPDEFDAMIETDATLPSLFGDPCDDDRECESGYCIDTPTQGRVCTKRCDGDCPEGFECTPTSVGGDDTLLCAVDGNDLCRSCQEDSDCDDAEDLCLKIGNLKYCGEACDRDEDCPSSFRCATLSPRDIDDESIMELRQCVPTSGECAPCQDDDGDGYGMGDDCLGFDCADDNPTRYEGAAEVCDLSDNDCDSLIDESLTDLPPDSLTCAEIGVCEGAEIDCILGEWACDYPEDVYEESELSCDGLDNDCDGTLDETLIAPLGDLSVGVCEGAEKICQAQEGWVNPDYSALHMSYEDLEMSCDTLDNDCDGTVDEGFDLQADVLNCGACGLSCLLPQSQVNCELGTCLFVGCDPNFFDINQDPVDGCEYGCTISAQGIELCDQIDNDCDGLLDEELQVPPPELFNCLEAGVCSVTEERCSEGRWVCEYPVELFEARELTCDGLDNDCDSIVDEQLRPPLSDRQAGVCAEATSDCAGESGWVEPSYEEYSVDYESEEVTCDTLDNDCDGSVDEGFDLASDVNHCGVCGEVCAYPNALPACRAGLCALNDCLPGYVDLNQDSVDGCEYACRFVRDDDHPDQDNLDEDCDGIDGSLDHAVFLSTLGADDLSGLNRREPVRSVSKALEIATANNRSQIWVAVGSYELSSQLLWDQDVGLYGGYNATFTERTEERSTLSFSSQTGFIIRGLTEKTTFAQLNISVTDRVISSQPARAMNIYDSADHFYMEDCSISAGRGGNGTSGSSGNDGSSGSRGQNASGSSGGVPGSVAGGSGANGQRRRAGATGAAGASNGSLCGGVGGSGSGSAGLGCNDGDPRAGGNGGDGCHGGEGVNGNHGGRNGSWFGRIWLPSIGSRGETGGIGGGGGGGGAGGGESCTAFGGCLSCGTGRGGGGGGGGGDGGAGGLGGVGGGASFAFIIDNASITLRDTSVSTAGGGNGGDGGGGGSGGAGGSGGSGATSTSNKEGDGGDGGPGGSGGDGGCGGGGGGGPSILFYGISSATVNRQGQVTLSLGQGGNAGLSCGEGADRGVALTQSRVTLN